jgi:hypothetical protein
MKANEFDACLKTTHLFAISPTSIEYEVPWNHRLSKTKQSWRKTCPLGLVKAKVIDTKAEWTSFESFGCTANSSSHEVTHKNGVLVQFTMPKDITEVKGRHVEVTRRGQHQIVRLVVSKAAIIMPWSDYKPVYDARRKAQREGEKRQRRLAAALNAVGASHGAWNETYKRQGDDREYEYHEQRATVQLPLLFAEQLAEVFAALDTNNAHRVRDEVRKLHEMIGNRDEVLAVVSADEEESED